MLQIGTECHYCGATGETIDHVVPQALLKTARDSGDELLVAELTERNRRMTVPACRECNGLAGWKYDPTLAERRHRIADAFVARYRRKLAMPDWEDSELRQLSPELMRLVLAGLVERDQLRQRLKRLRR